MSLKFPKNPKFLKMFVTWSNQPAQRFACWASFVTISNSGCSEKTSCKTRWRFFKLGRTVKYKKNWNFPITTPAGIEPCTCWTSGFLVSRTMWSYRWPKFATRTTRGNPKMKNKTKKIRCLLSIPTTSWKSEHELRVNLFLSSRFTFSQTVIINFLLLGPIEC